MLFAITKAPTRLETSIDKAMDVLDELDVDSEEYAKVLEIVIKLHKMKEEERPSRLSLDTAAIIGANLLGIMMIIRHEHVNVITSRAMGVLVKPK